MGEHNQHRQRVYNRFLREGLMGFEEHNAMEFLLFLAHARGDTNSLAHRVISTFGSLSAALDAPYEELVRVPGIRAFQCRCAEIHPPDVRILS